MRWHFLPNLGIKFGNEIARTSKELAAMMDRDDGSRRLGIQIMNDGWLRTWLMATGERDDLQSFDKIVSNNTASQGQKLESILHLLDKDLPWPKVVVDKREVKLGRAAYDSTKTALITISNAGRGFLSGGISLAGNSGGFTINQYDIEGGPVTVQITVRPLGLPVGSRQSTKIVAQTNGGVIEIPVSYIVAAPIWKMIGRSILAGILFGGILAGC